MLSELAAPMRRAAARHATDTNYLAELEQWSGCHGEPNGVPARNAPAARSSDELPVRVFSETELSEYTDEPDSARSLVVCTPHDNRVSQLRAGQATSAILLQATYLGLVTSLQSEPLGMLDLRDQIRTTPLESTPRRPVTEVIETN